MFSLLSKNESSCVKSDCSAAHFISKIHFRLYSKYRTLDKKHVTHGTLEANRRLWSVYGIRRLYSSSIGLKSPNQPQVAWERLRQMQTYGGLALTRLSKAAAVVSLALSRSNSHLIVPGLFAVVAGQLTCGERTWAQAESFPMRKTLYMCTDNGQVYLTSFVFSAIEAAILFLRTIYLAILFSPCIVMAPFADSLGAEFRKNWIYVLHCTLEKAGPAFIKWGQWAATRPDLFPQDVCIELAKLHTKAPAHGFAVTKRTIEGAFGRKLFEIFEEFEKEPVASGSVAQVHRATLKYQYPGQPIRPIQVAVKVRHPGVGEAIRRDFMIINFVARISKFIPTLNWLQLDESLKQFAVFMISQVDLAREAAHLSRFIYNFRRSKDVSFPKPLYPLVHPAVLVETFEHGENIMHYVDELEGNHRIKSALAHIGSSALLKMLLVDNFIHADMHPGNILVRLTRTRSGTQLPELRPHVVFLDVGMTAELSKRDRMNLISFFKALVLHDGRTAAESTLKLSKRQNCPNPEAFIEEVDSCFNFWDSSGGCRIDSADRIQKLMELVRHHKVNIDGDICTVIVTTLVLEGWQKKLDPKYNVMETMQKLLFKADMVESLSYTLEGLAAP